MDLQPCGDAPKPALKAVLIDLNGTLYIDEYSMPGSKDALNRLRSASLAVKFVTNTTRENKGMMVERLHRMLFNVQESEIFTSLNAARAFVEENQLRPLLLLEESAQEDFAGIETSNPNAVVIGLSPRHFNYQSLNFALSMILAGAPLIAIHKARYYRSMHGFILGPGPFVTALEHAAKINAIVAGKPRRLFFEKALAELGCSPSEAVMIGDDVFDDVNGAQNAGIQGILVRTGKYRNGDENKIDPPPYLTCGSFAEAVDHILSHMQPFNQPAAP